MKRLVLALTLVLLGCGKKDADPGTADPAPTPGSGSGSATTTGSGSATATATGTGSGSALGSGVGSSATATTDRCAEPCLLLKDGDLAATRTACPDWSLGKDPAACDEIDRTRNCIYAAYGYTFKKDRWKKEFAAAAWYEPDPAFADANMSKVALANVAELKAMAAACRDHTENQISAKTRAAVEAWFAKRNKGEVPPLPDHLTDLEGNTVDKATFTKLYLKDRRLFVKDKWESITWVEKRGDAEVVSVSTGVPDPAKCTGEGEECEGFEWMELEVKDGVITAITTFAAACPFVYEPDGAGGWAYRGEILKNLAVPAAEATRSLALAGTGCGAIRTVRITEEKREQTYLDAVALEIDGVTIAPDACGAVCADDGHYHVLATGDALELTFTLPAASCAAGTLVANGYYVPLR